VPADGGDDVVRAGLGGVCGRGGQQCRAGAAAAVVAVDDEPVDGHLRAAQHHRQRVGAEDGQPDRLLAPVLPAVRVRAGQDGEHHPVRGIAEQPAEPGGGRTTGPLSGERALIRGVGVVLPDQGEDRRQVTGAGGTSANARTPRTADTLVC
jgi:hypothetical protein